MPIGLSCYNQLVFCFKLTVSNLDWSSELPLHGSTWDVQICPYQGHRHFEKKITFENKWGGVTQDPVETAGQQECLVALSYLEISEKCSVARELKGKREM